MENLAIYLIKSSALIAVFFFAYYFLLRKETFFKSNRWFLLFGLVTSVILPLVTFKKVVWVAPRENFKWSDLPVNIETVETFEINWVMVLAIVYGIGLLLFMLKFVFDFSNLSKTLKGKNIKRQSDFKLVDIPDNVAPFSYFNYIVFNSALYSQSELDNILEHEKVHCEQYHSADVLVARFFCIFCWYNPFVWLYKKAMLQNLEFIADCEALKNISDKRAYQITLLKVTAHEHCVEISNHFYQSLIKKRIIMLNKNQSKSWNSWKYALIIPALAAFMFYFQVKVIAQEKENNNVVIETTAQETISVVINKNTTDAQMKKDAARLKEKHGISLKFSKVKRNSAGEIVAIKAVYKDKEGNSGTSQINGDEPIQPLRFYRNDDGQFGFGSGMGRDFRMRVAGHSDDDEDVEIAEMAEAPEAPEAPEMPEGSDVAPPSPTRPPMEGRNVKVIKGPSGVMTVTVDGEVVTVDTDKILADLEPMLAELENINVDIDMDDIQRSTKDAMKQALIQTKIARKQSEKQRTIDLEQQKRDHKQAQIDFEQQRRDENQARIDQEQAMRDMEQQKIDMEQSKKDLEQARKDLQRSKAEIEQLRARAKKK